VAESLTTTSPAPRARVQAMKEYHPPLGSRDRLRLDFNENTLACSPKVKEALAAVSAGSLTRYPEREPVEAMVAAHLGLKAEQVALTNGVDEAIHVLFETFLEAGDELLLPVPTYTMYEVYASATDARVVAVEAADDLQFPFERLLAAITPSTKVIAIANPNSPSGSAATREQLLELARRAPQAVLLVDEAYFHFHGETVMDLVGTVPNLIVARTFSKAYGLAGLRLGLLAGTLELMRWVRRVLSPYSVNSLALVCLQAALADEGYLNWYVGEVLAARTEFEAALDAAGVRRWPSRANFILVEIGARHAVFVRSMRASGVLVRDRSSDPGCDGRVRITSGTREQMRQAAVALNAALAAMRTGGETQ
jgi:histidinol-phosphate aminotransferase